MTGAPLLTRLVLTALSLLAALLPALGVSVDQNRPVVAFEIGAAGVHLRTKIETVGNGQRQENRQEGEREAWLG